MIDDTMRKMRNFPDNVIVGKLGAGRGRSRVQGAGRRVQGAGCRVQGVVGAGSRVQGTECRAKGQGEGRKVKGKGTTQPAT